jgi:hypothetical protein
MAQFRAKLDKLAAKLDGSSLRQITTRVATKSKANAIGAIEPNTLSHWGKGGKGYHVQARYEVKSNTTAVIQPTVVPLAALLEKGSGTTWKAPKRRGSARRKKGSVGSYTRAKVPARHAWTKAQEKVIAEVPPLVHKEVRRVLGEVF